MSTPDKAILVMLSGGLDSTYVLYKYLHETNLPVHVHHISIQVKQENRWEAEDSATTRILEYCQRYRAFSASFSTYKFDLPFTGWDADVQVMIGARVAANLDAKSVVVTLGINADDLQREEVAERQSRNVLGNLWTATRESIDEEQREKIYPTLHLPFKDIPKWQMMREMPVDLVNMTWSCRRPQFRTEDNGDIVGSPCCTCHACVGRQIAREELEKHLDVEYA